MRNLKKIGIIKSKQNAVIPETQNYLQLGISHKELWRNGQ